MVTDREIISHTMANLEDLKKVCRSVLSTKQPGNRTPEEIEGILKYARAASLFPAMADEDDLITICQGMTLIRAPPNTLLFLQGQPGKDYFILFKGQIEIYKANDESHRDQLLRVYTGKEMTCLGSSFSRSYFGILLACMPVNKGFGEIALMKEGGLRACAAVTSRDSEIIGINPALYKACLRQYHCDSVNIGERFNFLAQLPVFKGVRSRDTTDIAYKLKDASFSRMSKIYEIGQEITEILIILEGEVGLFDNKTVELDIQDPLTGEPIPGAHDHTNFGLEVARVSRGTLLGALELYQGQKFHLLAARAASKVTGFVMDIPEFNQLRIVSPSLDQFIKQEKLRMRQRKETVSLKSESLVEALKVQLNSSFSVNTHRRFTAKSPLDSGKGSEAATPINGISRRSTLAGQLPTLISKDLRQFSAHSLVDDSDWHKDGDDNQGRQSRESSFVSGGQSGGFSRASGAASVYLQSPARPKTAAELASSGSFFFNDGDLGSPKRSVDLLFR